jgi:hypothetical protein
MLSRRGNSYYISLTDSNLNVISVKLKDEFFVRNWLRESNIPVHGANFNQLLLLDYNALLLKYENTHLVQIIKDLRSLVQKNQDFLFSVLWVIVEEYWEDRTETSNNWDEQWLNLFDEQTNKILNDLPHDKGNYRKFIWEWMNRNN